MSCGDPTEGWEIDLSDFQNKSPYFIIALEECLKCKNRNGYEFNQASYSILANKKIIHTCTICDYKWEGRRPYPIQLELW